MGLDNPLFALLTAAPIIGLYWLFLRWLAARRSRELEKEHFWRESQWSAADIRAIQAAHGPRLIINRIKGRKMEDPDHAHMGEVKSRPECEHEWTKTEDGHVDPYGHCTKCQLLAIYRSSVEFL